MKDYIEERAVSIANYIIDNNATVRQTAKEFGVSKSTVHVEVILQRDAHILGLGAHGDQSTAAGGDGLVDGQDIGMPLGKAGQKGSGRE